MRRARRLARRGSSARRDSSAALDEAVGLARAIGLDVRLAEIVPLAGARPATLFGTGKVEEYKGALAARKIDLVIVDHALTPVQQRNLETAWGVKVIDRTGLILEIFGERARTKEGTLQVELAALSYQRSRLVRSWTHLERQRGGFGFMGGPGERQIEADRRLIDRRITRLKIELETVRRTRRLHRESRNRVPYPVIALVGYTNAGKSTLFNRLTRARVMASDMLFATLDPAMRALELPGGPRAILSDTVGFVSNLPTDLVAAFAATLEEVRQAEIIVHVRDIAHPYTDAQLDDVLGVLTNLGVDIETAAMVEVHNKIDLLPAAELEAVRNRAHRHAGTVAVSAVTGEGIDDLIAVIGTILRAGREELEVRIAHADGATLAWLYDRGEVVARAEEGHHARLRVRLSPADAGRFRRRHGLDLAAAD